LAPLLILATFLYFFSDDDQGVSWKDK
jgi:hypothetical protein